ncbi:hypothetical protein BDK51DRAFT_46540 [Blyttiomyces helicus]|uniref:Uncharacterized protein n=1 Tax=Blyttiomyces helicus TaxID=388810 RepID=A0A4P9W688_9FUNG|nr:hypothetical protein BDK51DRAFT_46540 [Blyttiomyces helicus]|eukprot:RKO86260.1 hypothetical protein BDK51DRAFT_46540 [Blyttiomyces helicus]
MGFTLDRPFAGPPSHSQSHRLSFAASLSHPSAMKLALATLAMARRNPFLPREVRGSEMRDHFPRRLLQAKSCARLRYLRGDCMPRITSVPAFAEFEENASNLLLSRPPFLDGHQYRRVLRWVFGALLRFPTPLIQGCSPTGLPALASRAHVAACVDTPTRLAPLLVGHTLPYCNFLTIISSPPPPTPWISAPPGSRSRCWSTTSGRSAYDMARQSFPWGDPSINLSAPHPILLSPSILLCTLS